MYFFYIDPSFSEVKQLSLKKSGYNTVLEKSKELAIKRDSVLADYNSISQTDINRLDKIIPNEFNAVLFANDVSTLASGYGITVKDFKINEPKTEVRDVIINQPKNEGFKTITVSFRLSGGYSQFVRFLSDLESSLRLVDVTSLSVKPNSSQASGLMDYLLEVHTYSLR